jgi:hypothetical protein
MRHAAAGDRCRLTTAAIFRQPSILRNLMRLPLCLGEAEGREELVTAFPQTRHNARQRLPRVRSKDTSAVRAASALGHPVALSLLE